MVACLRTLIRLGLVLAFVPGIPLLAIHNHKDLRTGAFTASRGAPIIRSVERCGKANHLHSYTWTFQERCPACLANLCSQVIEAPTGGAKAGIQAGGEADRFRSKALPRTPSRFRSGRAPPFATIV